VDGDAIALHSNSSLKDRRGGAILNAMWPHVNYDIIEGKPIHAQHWFSMDIIHSQTIARSQGFLQIGSQCARTTRDDRT
jgi:hypothetical protein